MTFLRLDAVTKDFPNGTRAVDSVDLSVEQGELMVLVGPSGCGKTTLLRMISGLESTTSGRILLAGEDVTSLDPGDRDLAMVFQSYALYPHMSVRGNLSFGLRMNRLPKREIEERVQEAARFLQLTELLDRRPAQLSGGQRQRVAMGRAMVRRPNAFLMDEPLSNLDAKLRVQMRGEVTRIQRQLGITTVYVTHDQVEAMTMGDRVAVLDRGRIQQVATPAELYDEPANLFVAGFLGSPAMSFLQAEVEEDADGLALRFRSHRVALPAGSADTYTGLRREVGGRIAVGVRSEDVAVRTRGPNGAAASPAGTLPGRVMQLEMLGAEAIIYALVDADPVDAEQLEDLGEDAEPLAPGGEADGQSRQAMLIAKSDRAAARLGLQTPVDLELDLERLHLFDLSTGESLKLG